MFRHTCTAAKGSLKCRACAMGVPPEPSPWPELLEKLRRQQERDDDPRGEEG